MNKDEIDELLSDLNSKNDENSVYKIYGVTRDDVERMTNEQLEELVKKICFRIMSEIEKGDYEYFIGKFEDINYSEIIGVLIECESQSESKEKTEWKNSIKKQVLYKIRDSKTNDEKRKYDFIPLIKSIKDIDFLKECIEKRDEYGFNEWNIRDIIVLVGEDEFTKECINRREELGINNSIIIGNLIKTINNHEIKKECIIDDEYAERIICEAYNKEEIVEIIKTKKIGGRDLRIDILKKLIYFVNNYKKLDEILGEKDKREEYQIDSEFLKELIERRDEVFLFENEAAGIVKIIGDSDYTLGYIIMNYVNEFYCRKDILLNLIKSVEYFNNLDFIDYSILESCRNPIDYIIEKSSPEFLVGIWDKISDDLKGKCITQIINALQQKGATEETITIIKQIGLNPDKLMELLTIEDSNYLEKHIINNIISRGINDKVFKLDDLNEEIDKLYNVFLTTNLPIIFKEFEFFKNHNNYGSVNYNLYEGKSISERDANIRNDLFRIALESNNKQLRTFLENLYNR